MYDRVAAEVRLLETRYPLVNHGPNYEWVRIHDVALPPGRFTQTSTDVLILIPPAYPVAPPDDFFVRGDLTLGAGGTPPAFNRGPNSSSGVTPLPGDWGWFSWHAASWKPAADVTGGDNLITYMRSIKACLRGEEQ